MAVLSTDRLLADTLGTGRLIPYVLLAWLLLAVGLRVNAKLRSFDHPLLEWSPFHIRANITLLPLRTRAWPVYALALALAMPFLALLEEAIFRANILDVPVAPLLWGAVAFGLFHLTSLVSIRMVIYLSAVGAVLVEVYAVGGLAACFVVHATYNLTALALILYKRDVEFAR